MEDTDFPCVVIDSVIEGKDEMFNESKGKDGEDEFLFRFRFKIDKPRNWK